MNVYEIITQRIIEKLESGVIPWQQCWKGGINAPKNFVSGKTYRGINAFWLAAQGYTSPYWLSFKQCRKLEGQVKKGEKATPVIFFSWFDTDKTNDKGEAEQRAVLRYYNVFNVEQCERLDVAIDIAEPVIDFEPLEQCVKVVDGMPLRPDIKHVQQRACYHVALDYVNMPKPETFDSPEMYYSVLFHELTHSTGHESRLNRKFGNKTMYSADKDYSKEELVAEMGAAYLSAHCAIDNQTLDSSAAYIDSWINVLKGDYKLLVHAAAQAQKAADYILNTKGNDHE